MILGYSLQDCSISDFRFPVTWPKFRTKNCISPIVIQHMNLRLHTLILASRMNLKLHRMIVGFDFSILSHVNQKWCQKLVQNVDLLDL